MKKVILFISAILAIGGVYALPVMADKPTDTVCSDGKYDDEQKAAAGCNTNETIVSPITNIINTGIALVGIIAVAVIIISAYGFLTAAGDAGKLKRARDGILYAVIALVVAALAYAIVTFVSQAVTTNSNTGNQSSQTT